MTASIVAVAHELAIIGEMCRDAVVEGRGTGPFRTP